MKKNYLHIIIVTVMFFFSLATTAAANEIQTGAKTPPPPIEFHPNGFFDPDHKYLMDGTNYFSEKDSDTAHIEATTYAKQEVDYIGVTFYIMEWKFLGNFRR